MYLFAMGVEELTQARAALWADPPAKTTDSMFDLDCSDDDIVDGDDNDSVDEALSSLFNRSARTDVSP